MMRSLFTKGIGLLCLLLISGPALADPQDGPLPNIIGVKEQAGSHEVPASSKLQKEDSDSIFIGNVKEQEALQAYDLRKLIRAREIAEEVLKDKPNSFVGNFVLGRVMHHAEARHPRAYFLLKKALRILVDNYGYPPEDPQAIFWHQRILQDQISLLSELDRLEDQLKVIDEYDSLYRPKLTGARIWPLMKLHRFDEAIEAAEALMTRPDLNERITGYNGRMAIEDERKNRLGGFSWGVEGFKKTQERSCILAFNTSLAAIGLFKYDEAEKYARLSIQADNDDCPGSAYQHLVTVYLAEAEFNRAVSAYKNLRKSPIMPRFRPMLEPTFKALLVEILLSLNHTDTALDLIKEAYERPNRPSLTSISKEDFSFYYGIMYWKALELKKTSLKEQIATRSFWDGMGLQLELKKVQAKQWEVSQKLKQLAPEQDLLVSFTRPFLRDIYQPWHTGFFGDIFGYGLAMTAVKRAKALDEEQLGKDAHGYFQAIEGEMAFRHKDLQTAIQKGEEALQNLQVNNKLLRYQVEAYLAAAYYKRGDQKRATALFEEVLNRYPTAIRSLGISIPVTLRHDQNDFVKAFARRLMRSPRLEVRHEAPFQVLVSGDDKALRICLSSQTGFQFACSDLDMEEHEEEGMDWALDAFHKDLFSPRIDLSSSDINSLDGSTIRINAKEVLKGLLGTQVEKKDGERP